MFKIFQKFTLSLILGIFMVCTVVGSLVPVVPARAQPVSIAADLPRTLAQVLDQIWEGLKAAVLGAAARVVSFGLRKVAYDSAVWLASGGQGQSPLAHTQNFGDYLSSVGDQAFGQAIEELGKPFGMNLCKLPDVKLDLALKVGIRTDFLAGGDTSDLNAKPSCTFQDFSKNWFSGDAWNSKYGNGQLGIDFNKALQIDNNDFGVQLDTKAAIGNKVIEKKEGASLQRAEGQGFLPKTGIIAGNIQTPAALTGEGFKGITPDKTQAEDNQTLQSLIAQGNVKVIPNVLGMFLSTLASTMVKNFQEKGILPFGIGCMPGKEGCLGGDGAAFSDYTSGGFVGGRSAAQQFFQSFLETPAITQSDSYDVLGNLGNCEGDGVYNCRADSGLIAAIQQAQSDKPVTIADAIKNNMLHGDYKLIPPSRVADNADKSFCQRNYCYSNIVVLVNLRILPLGFQIAAERSDPDHPWSLNDVVNGFDTPQTCPYDSVSKPFCHLIDPSWVIKLPQTRCAANVYGPSPVTSGAGDRLQECADLQNCVSYNNDGSCKSFGYCTREKNAWNFSAGSCSAQYSTCTTYQNSAGQAVSYLYRTLDTGFCSKDTVGCREYSINSAAGTGWVGGAAPSNANGYVQTAMFFNGKLPSASVCTSGSAGCTMVTVASSTDANGNSVQIPIKIAPDYLGCYDSDSVTQGVQWPQTPADLVRINPSTACNQYAQACIPDERSCNWYTPAYGGTKIPGRYTPATVSNNVISWNDECAAVCVGYNSYQELPSAYSAGTPIAYITPPNNINNNTDEKVCTAADAGCSSFTNLSTTQNGLEKTEYFSYLRACVPPDQNPGATFITYEGTTQGGFQLKSYLLVPDDSGAPAYFSKDSAELTRMQTTCTEALYQAGTADPDCRQFSDSKGVVSYRILSHTIPVSAQCTPYRLNNTELYISALANTAQSCAAAYGLWDGATCKMCYQNGRYDANQGACVYYGLPGGVNNTAGTSNSCSAAANTCRAYKGNAGNNVKIVFTDTFEGSTTSAWGPTNQVSISGESTRVGGHSLTISGLGAPTRGVPIDLGSTYELSFWAKGSAGLLGAHLSDGDTGAMHDFPSVTIGDTWQQYHVGPIDVNGFVSTTAYLRFINFAAGKLYLDNITLTQLGKDSVLYLVKNTLKVDALCDADQTDNLPGAALGCMAYQRGSDQKNVFVTNFSNLCREGAIGCSAVFNTHNTAQESGPHAYQVYLNGGTGKVGNDTYSCALVAGQSGCYVSEIKNHSATEIIAALGAGAFTRSTVYVPEDTPSTSPIYLVANEAGSCSKTDVGCMLAGTRIDTPTGATFVTTTIKNNPDDPAYTSMLCTNEAVGCGAYSVNGGTSYFKDPSITGQKICTYKTDVTKSGTKYSGWFWKGVGVCSNNNALQCTADAQCGDANTCVAKDEQPCYPSYIQNGSDYGLYSYGDAGKYKNFVGECPSDQNMCTEFIDHNDIDTSINPSGTPKSYFVIKDANLNGGDCNGSVNLKNGCALFDEAGNPNKYWSTADLYAASAASHQAVPAAAPADPARADANIILKVVRDRTCGEWLQCSSSHTVFDQATGKFKSVCDSIGRCDMASDANKPGDAAACIHWVDPNANGLPQVLTASTYASRDISWNGMEYDGMSLLNFFPIDTLKQQNLASQKSSLNTWRLVEPVPCGGGPNCAIRDPKSLSTQCVAVDPGCEVKDVDNQTCVPNILPCGIADSAQCLNGTCVQSVQGESRNILDVTPRQLCRAFPEKNSPFPNSTLLNASTQFSGVNICNETGAASSLYTQANACECDYTKANYNDVITKYWNYSYPNQLSDTPGQVPSGLCQGGSRDGASCSTNDDCYDVKNGSRVTTGICQTLKRSQQYIGWRGYCLQQDMSRSLNGDPNQHPCVSWFPVDSLEGALDINNQHTEAGFQGPPRYYCLNSNGGAQSGTNYDLVTEDNGSLTLSDGGNGQFGQAFQAANLAESKIKMADIEKITFTEIDGDSEDPQGGVKFEMWPMDPNDQQASYYVNTRRNNENDDRGRGYAVTGHFLGSGYQMILMYGSNVLRASNGGNDIAYVDKIGTVCYPAVDGNGVASTANSSCHNLSGKLFGQGAQISLNGVPQVVSNVADPEALFKPAACPLGPPPNEANKGNWHAIRLDFDPVTGLFKGYRWAYCDDSPNNGLVNYQVTFKLKEQCQLVADVRADYSQSAPSAVWTDRMWKVGRYGGNLGGLSYPYNAPAAAYGGLDTPNLSPSTAQVILTPFTAPLALVGNGVCNIANPLTSCKCPSQSGFRDGGCLYTLNYPNVSFGAPYSCGVNGGNCNRSAPNASAPGGVDLFSTTAGSKNVSQGQDALAELVARPLGVSQFRPNGTSWAYQDYAIFNYTENGSGGVAPKAPTVVAIGTCLSSSGCLEGPVGVSVNGESAKDIYLFGASKKATVRFFAWADQNQMPVRQVKVNWGDTVVTNQGEFRNHRGLTQSHCVSGGNGNFVCEVSGSSCDPAKNDADCPKGVNQCLPEAQASNFGAIVDKTCDNSYFQYDHTYTCTPGQNGFQAQCSVRPDLFPNGCCVYKPAVQVKDNWGWYNGACPIVDNNMNPVRSPGGNGCYDASWMVLPSNTQGRDEGLLGTAFTPFANQIYVSP